MEDLTRTTRTPTERKVTYRQAVRSDVEQLARLCFDYFSELDTGMRNYSLGFAEVVNHLVTATSPTSAPTFVATVDGEIVGVYGMEYSRYWWYREYHVGDYIWYVKPEFRKGADNVGKELLKLGLDWVKKSGKAFRPALLNLDRLKAKDRVFESLGLTRCGSIFNLNGV